MAGLQCKVVVEAEVIPARDSSIKISERQTDRARGSCLSHSARALRPTARADIGETRSSPKKTQATEPRRAGSTIAQ